MISALVLSVSLKIVAIQNIKGHGLLGLFAGVFIRIYLPGSFTIARSPKAVERSIRTTLNVRFIRY